MSAWPLAKIGSLTTKVGSGATPLGGESAYKPSGVPLIRSMNVHLGGFKRDGLAFLDEKQAKGLDNAVVKAHDVLLNITGASIGRVTWAPADLEGARVNQHVCIIRPREELESKFLSHFLASPPQQRRIMREQVGATRQGLTKGRILEFDVPVPPLAEQRRIVAKIEELFSDLDAGVAALGRVKANLKRYRAAVLKAAVEGRLTEDWRRRHPDTEPASKLLERILADRRTKWEQDQLRRFKEAGKTPPKGWKERYKQPPPAETKDLAAPPPTWCWASIEQLSTKVVDGVHRKPNYVATGIPFVTVRNLTAGPGISFEKLNYVTERDHTEFSKRTDVQRGDILISKDGTLGVVRVVRTDAPFSIFVSVALVKPVNYEYSDYLGLAMSSLPVQRQMVPKGSGLQHIHLEDLRCDAVPLAPLAEQSEIVAEVDRRLSVADAAEQQVEHALQRAARLRQAILKRAFEGRLVAQDPSDEPASAMLQRLQASGAPVEKGEPTNPRRARTRSTPSVRHPRSPKEKSARG